ncbi:bacteriophage T4 gp5 trimerisation domain-containing protein [Sulfurimonas sp.]|uniref:bacteriophage T4 gp5 trimerisation domain-containing protein n=1 Tax=Sulfurimonas sp. TaxID=2022749 RepID=UPI003C76BDE1
MHNGENRHPFNLPKEKTKSFIKTQTTPQYEDKEGYNELLFEDKQGEELLSLRAQNDYELNVLNNSNTHIANNKKTIIDNDLELSVQNDSTQTIGNDKKVNILGNEIKTIEKEQILTIKEDQEIHILRDANTIINNNQKTIIEQDLIQRIKGQVTHYIEKDQKEKYLANLFLQIEAELGIEITSSYHLNAKTIKQEAETVEIEASDGISLKCGGSVLTVDGGGIHLKASKVDTNSGNAGVTASNIAIAKIEKPLYNKLRVTKVEASITKQDEITQVLTYTASVEKFEDGAWSETTELTTTQEAQINWYFIKNNDQENKDILTDNPTDDTINSKGLKMSVTLEKENVYKHGHAHAFVVDAVEEGYEVTELKRYLEVEDILVNITNNDNKEFEAQAIYNVDEITEEEKAETRWTVEGKDVPASNAKGTMTHTYKGEKLDPKITAYIETTQMNVAVAHANFADSEEEINGEEKSNE